MSIVGLALDIAGVVLLFCYAPEKYSDPQWSAFFAVEGESKKRREEWKELQPKRKKRAGFAVFLIVFGFVFQLLGEVMDAGFLNRMIRLISCLPTSGETCGL